MSSKRIVRRVLVFPAGTESGLEIHAALHTCKEVQLFGAGTKSNILGKAVFEDWHPIPSVTEPDWLKHLTELCKQLEIDYVIPAHDDVLMALVRNARQIPARVIAPPRDTCEISRSKRATYDRLAGSVRVPRLFSHEEIHTFPIFVKPDCGQGSQGAVRVDDVVGLAVALRSIQEPLLCEYLPGEEFTVDCFSDRDRGILFAGARQRLSVRNGIAVHTRTVDLPEALVIAQRISSIVKLHGAWFFQLKRAWDGELTLLEFAPRIAGSMAANRVRGINFPLLSLFESERLPLTIKIGCEHVELHRPLSNRYGSSIKFSCAYIDLDDTLLINEKVNVEVIRFLFRCINENKPVHLITRHRKDLSATLNRHRLSGLFDRIIHIAPNERKSDYILEPDALFIDDSFSERQEVALRLGIPTLDNSMLELVLH